MRLVSLNTQLGLADPGEIVSHTADADVVVLVEVTRALYTDLVAQGLTSRFPYQVGAADPRDYGTIVVSRWPMRRLPSVSGSGDRQHVAEIAVAGNGRTIALRLIATHPRNPMGGAGPWLEEGEILGEAVRRTTGDLVVAGDLNATPDHLTYRRVLAEGGLRSAIAESGSGWLPTWPVGYRFLPVLLPIDHVLIRGSVQAQSVSTFTVRGTDHRGLLARLTVG